MGSLTRNPTSMTTSLRWDIFCRVVDNFGDAGVCWRLARQLADEHGLAVTLWIDDVASLAPHRPRPRAGRCRPARRAACACAAWMPATHRRTGAPTSSSKPSAAASPTPTCRRWPARRRHRCGSCSNTSPRSRGSTRRTACLHRIPRLPLTRWFWFPGIHRQLGWPAARAGLLEARDALRAQARAAASALCRGGGGRAPARRFTCRCSATRIRRCPRCSTPGPTATNRWCASCPKASPDAALDRWTGGVSPPARPPRTRGRLTLTATAVRRPGQRSTAGSGVPTSTSFGARTRSSARNGRRSPSSGTSIRRKATPTSPRWTPSSRASKWGSRPRQRQRSSAFWYAWNAADPDACGGRLAGVPPATRRRCGRMARGRRRSPRRPDLADRLVRLLSKIVYNFGFPSQSTRSLSR